LAAAGGDRDRDPSHQKGKNFLLTIGKAKEFQKKNLSTMEIAENFGTGRPGEICRKIVKI
jgi:hypothetical protein